MINKAGVIFVPSYAIVISRDDFAKWEKHKSNQKYARFSTVCTEKALKLRQETNLYKLLQIHSVGEWSVKFADKTDHKGRDLYTKKKKTAK